MSVERVRVGLTPAVRPWLGARLLEALEGVLPIAFSGLDQDAVAGCAGVVLGASETEWLARGAERGIPAYVVEETGPRLPMGEGARVDLEDSALLDSRLRGQSLVDRKPPELHGLELKPGDVVLATVGGSPVWALRERESVRYHRVGFAPGPLPDEQVLWQQFHRDRFIGLLPLVSFLREIAEPVLWTPPPLRASLVIDDPNLHGMSFGHLDFRKLADHAQEHEYHACFAMVPLDAWYASPRARTLLRERSRQLSLTMHGVYHLPLEMAQPMPIVEATAYLLDGLRRLERFESRYQVPVSRVMTAPYGQISREMCAAMARTPLDGICMSGKPIPYALDPPPTELLAGWQPGTFVEGSFPVIMRDDVTACCVEGHIQQDLVLKAFLDQPLVFGAHHWDFRQGLGIMEKLIRLVNRVGKFRWQTLDGIMKSNYCTRRRGSELEVRLFARNVEIDVPPGVRCLTVDIAPMNALDEHRVWANGRTVASGSFQQHHRIRLDEVAEGRLTLRLVPEPLVSQPLRSSRKLYYALWRRILCEARDRLRLRGA